MKNLSVQFKLIVYLIFFLNTFHTLESKNIEKFIDAKDLSNYFSGILAINDNQYQKSYQYLKSLNNLEDSHYVYSQYFNYNLVTLKKFKDANNYSKKLEKKKIDNFESNIVSAIYYLENKKFAQANKYFKKLKSQSQPGTIENLLSASLSSWSNFKDIDNLNSALILLEVIPKRFKNIKDIQKTFAYCYFDSNKTEQVFKNLTSNPDIDYSRYFFFHINYLVSKNKESQAIEVLQRYLKLHPKNLILNQLKIDLENKETLKNQFECKNSSHVIAEVLYIVANALASQKNYIGSNFYLNLAKYLNPNFVSYEVQYAENFYRIEEYAEAKNIYEEIKKNGSIYNWQSSKRITSILIKQDKKKEAIKYLKNSFQKLEKPNIYQIFDYAEFLKNNEQYKESIEYHSHVLRLITSQHELYSATLDSRGVSYERTNQWDKAEIDLLNALRAKPNNAYIINYLAYSWIEKGLKIEKSLKMLKKANELRPNDGYIIDSLGWAFYKLKNYKDAKKYLEQAVRYMASDPVVNDHYADALWMNNNPLQARYYWRYVLRLEKTEEKLKEKIKQKLLFGLKA